ncbi:MAG: hypothetical protein JRI23_07580, partial [Deltaproteobacteria bacterium]|nr:hypothetical protein [Deltaproteobacteria bacterium]MBW2531455.1 hypothetical protein [Deltaproteobacteria bacterium]
MAGEDSEADGRRRSFRAADGPPARLLFRLGLHVPPPHDESRRLLRQSRELLVVVQQIAAATGCPADGAQLLRKVLLHLMVAALLVDGAERPTSLEGCAAAVAASPRLKKLFRGVLEELSVLDELLDDSVLVRGPPPELADRYDALLAQAPALLGQVGNDLDDQLRVAGGRPGIARAIVGAAAALALGGFVLLVA